MSFLDFITGADRPAPVPEPLHLPMIIKFCHITFDDAGVPTGYTDDFLEWVNAGTPKLERARGLNVHDWSIFFPPTIHETYASTTIEYMVTRK